MGNTYRHDAQQKRLHTDTVRNRERSGRQKRKNARAGHALGDRESVTKTRRGVTYRASYRGKSITRGTNTTRGTRTTSVTRGHGTHGFRV